ncbi:hypothetical protein OSTOST_00285 [Ostertagia ostertagi]
MCYKKFTTWKFFYSHIKKKHCDIKSEHIAYRKKEADEYQTKKRSKKLKLCLPGEGVRSRSLSPECSGAVRDQRELDGTGLHDADNCNISPLEESNNKDQEMVEIKEESMEVVAGCSVAPWFESAQEDSQHEHKQTKTKKGRQSSTPPATQDSGEERHSSMSLRASRSRRSSTSLELPRESSPKALTPSTTPEDSIMKDVTKVRS